ncbi:uncharacterized protein LOC111259899 isoform X3 [Varroa jacobsoni]|uniref:uncharacterized protein LOC111259899 isoform X3 n=1 Tax=Varroa jacobsoni TaxID=62625 RepID=UPI000BF4B875|nr:uncharacterized protein LOC111259899 isoform X3 [Varroa jacobsoni]
MHGVWIDVRRKAQVCVGSNGQPLSKTSEFSGVQQTLFGPIVTSSDTPLQRQSSNGHVRIRPWTGIVKTVVKTFFVTGIIAAVVEYFMPFVGKHVSVLTPHW